ncbi:uncharacterized protein C2orf50 homolog [Girardinichthys multiradiatus]|uniref:uncharacterized protein C2orf50 homolog n=1 Tax=Girardinichthys multiradiatus TaxID=208333 RepID=UPI001FAD5ACD|nr:uncharacterized protein C2orf50 homolog [Girardinichthys multiradiatus]
MDLKSVKQVSSAAYRFPEQPKDARPATSHLRTDRRTRDPGENADARNDAYWKNPAKQDQVWKDLVSKERRQALQWEKTWGFLLKFDTLGGPKEEKPLPNNISFFSGSFPKTSNQIYGSRQLTPLGRDMIGRDWLILWPGSQRCRKTSDLEMQPC